MNLNYALNEATKKAPIHNLVWEKRYSAVEEKSSLRLFYNERFSARASATLTEILPSGLSLRVGERKT